MTDEAIRALRDAMDVHSIVHRDRDSEEIIMALADEALRRGQEILAAAKIIDGFHDRSARLEAALRKVLALPCLTASDMDIIEMSACERARAALAEEKP